MPVRPLNPDAVSPATAAMFDLLCDGAWHRNQEIVAAGAAAILATERDEALKAGRRVRRKTLAKGQAISDDDLATSGANDVARNRLMIAVRSGRVERDGNQHRMLEEAIAQWIAMRSTTALGLPAAEPAQPTEPETSVSVPAVEEANADTDTETIGSTTTTRGRAPLIFGGIREEGGWQYAPLKDYERAHFHLKLGELPLREFRADLPSDVIVSYDEGEGLYRVDCPPGTGTAVAAQIRAWCEVHGYETDGLRVDQVKRRSPKDLPQAFLDDLCRHYLPFSLKRLQRNMSTIRMYIPESDDVEQSVGLWILEAIERYDDTKGVPFGAYLATRLTKSNVHELSRAAYGRTATDIENNQQKAVAAFIAEHQRRPSEKELAEYMGQSVRALRRNEQTIARINALRNMQSIDGGGSDSVEIPIPDAHEAPDQIMDETQQSVLSMALTSACAPEDGAKGRQGQANVLGWAAMYFTTWGNETKTALAERMDTSMRNMNVYADRVQTNMRKSLADIMD